MRGVLLAAVAALAALTVGCGPEEPKDDLSRFVAPAPGRVENTPIR